MLAFERCRFSHFGVLTEIDMSSHVVPHLASRAYHRWISSELNESDRGTRTTAEQNIRLVSHLLDDQHSEPYGERDLRPSSLQHRVNCFEKSDNSPSAMVGSSFEHEGFCTRSSFAHWEQQSNCNEGAMAIPTEFCVGSTHIILCQGESCWPRP